MIELEMRTVPSAPDFGGVAYAVLSTPDLEFVYLAERGGGPRFVVQNAIGIELVSEYAFEIGFTGGLNGVYAGGEIWIGANVGGGPVIARYNMEGNELGRSYVGPESDRNGVLAADFAPHGSVESTYVEPNPFTQQNPVEYLYGGEGWIDESGGWGPISVGVRNTNHIPVDIILAIREIAGDVAYEYRIAVGRGTPPPGVDVLIDATDGESALSIAGRILSLRI
jgi:hypothetical protein